MILKAELVNDRKHSQLVNIVRREQSVDTVWVCRVAFNLQVLLEQVVIFNDPGALHLAVGCQKLTFDNRRSNNRLTGAKTGTVVCPFVATLFGGYN